MPFASRGFVTIADGKLDIKRSDNVGTSYFWPAAKLDPALDFKIETVVTRKAGDADKGFFVAWGIKDSNTNFMFGISGDGSYVVGGYYGDKWKARLDWTDTPAIDQGFATNKLAVVRRGPALEFYINDTLVGRAPFEELADVKAGVGVGTGLETEVSSFRIDQYPSASKLLDAAADDALAKSDLPGAIRLYSLAGDADKLGGLANTCVAGGQLDLARNALLGAGLSDMRRGTAIGLDARLCRQEARGRGAAEGRRMESR